MNKADIKEILDLEIDEDDRLVYIDYIDKSNEKHSLECFNAGQLLDYITNLQTIEQQYSAILSENAELENKITNLQEELKEANDSITWWNNRFKAVERDNRKLKEENEKLAIELNKNMIERNNFLSRNEKVISYIDSLFNTIDYKDEEFITFETLQNIQNLAKYGSLNGGDEE